MLKERTAAFSKRFVDNPFSATSTFINNRVANLQANKLDQKTRESLSTINLEQTLLLLGQHEMEKKTAPYRFGIKVEQNLLSDEGLRNIREGSKHALQKHPDSTFLIFLRAVSLAHFGEHTRAHNLVSSAIIESRRPSVIKHYGDVVSTRRTIALCKAWKVLDKIARNNMKWQTGQSSADNGYDRLEFLEAFDFKFTNDFNVQMALFFAEPLLQGKAEDKYLDVCKQVYSKMETLPQKLRAIASILQSGTRRLPDYHKSYQLADELYQEIKPLWHHLLGPLKKGGNSRNKDPKKVITVFRQILRIANQLDHHADAEQLVNAMMAIAFTSWGRSTKWLVARTVMEYDPVKYRSATIKLLNTAPEKPQTMPDIQHYMVWCNHAQQYDEGIAFFEKQPGKVHRHACAMTYVNLLQRVGRFQDAADVAKRVNAALCVRPHTFCPYTVWSVRQRTGELQFAGETADYYEMVPQPKTPKGVIFITARTLDQLRRTPIVVLLEWKRLGWAVIPLVEGLLPKQPTGIAEIDAYIGCVTLNRQLTVEGVEKFKPVKGFCSEPEKGQLKWRGIDLSHALWEEAAINRRVYDVDFTCPLLKQYLGRSVKWTHTFSIVLEDIHNTMRKLKLRTGMLISFNYRLPDAVFRFYCEKFGDVDSFFCIHSANGYQNYFANFSTNISTKTVIRNMTRYPMTRSGSFPIPEKFESFYKKHEKERPHILEMVRDVTKVNRSAIKQDEIPQDAKLTLAMIHAWKADGGKVACAFGKVVCDSGVPYDGGPAHKNMKDWLNHTIECVKDSNTLLLIKPHPHEHKEEIACFINAYFEDLIETELPPNVIILGHRWFNINQLKEFVDLGLIYNGTTSVELGILNIPSVLCSYFSPIDYPVGHVTPKNADDYRRYVRFEEKAMVMDDLPYRSACWLYYMSGNELTKNYRYHARQITNINVYPTWWFKEDIHAYFRKGDPSVTQLAMDAIESEK